MDHSYEICCIVKDEERFVREWAEWHLKLGFDRISLFEDWGSRSHLPALEGLDGVDVYRMDGNVWGLRNWHSSRTQLELYEWFLDERKRDGRCDWVGFLDVDEFVMLDEGLDLDGLTHDFESFPGLLLSWKFYGANGHVSRPSGGVMDSYTKEGGSDGCRSRWQVKSLVNVKLAEGMRNLHVVEGGVKTNGDGDLDSSLCYDKGWINHYFSKSWEDFVERMSRRGNFHNDYRTYDSFFCANPDMADRKRELIESVRECGAVSSMWLSRELGLIVGGNLRRIEELESCYGLK